MTSKNNAASKAVQAEPCQKQAKQESQDTSKALPTMQQAMSLACAMAADSLDFVINKAVPSVTWIDAFGDAINAAELALESVRSLEAELPLDEDEFCVKWSRLGSVVRLAAGDLPEKSGVVWFSLSRAASEIPSLYDIVAFLCHKEGGAA